MLFWIATLLYGGCLALLGYNCYWYSYKQERYKNFYVAAFYVFSIIIVISRFASYLVLLVVFYQSSLHSDTLLLAQTVQGIAIYADICLGMIQVAAMRVLTLQLRGEFPDSIERKEKQIYCVVIAMTITLWIGVGIDTVLASVCEHKAKKEDNDSLKCLTNGVSKQGAQYINGTFFLLLFVLMVITVVPLSRVLRKVAKNQTLSSNVKWLTSIFGLFTFAFMSRAIYDYATKIGNNFWTVFLGLSLPLIWDFLPIFMMSLLHYRDAMVERKEVERDNSWNASMIESKS